MLLKYIVLVILLTGLICTLTPKVPGTVIIFLGAILYGVFTELASFDSRILLSLLALSITAEIGGRYLRIYLMSKYHVSQMLNANTAVGSIAGLVVSDTVFGPALGTLLWELLSGKTLIPNWKSIVRVTFRMASAALVRFVCGLAMIIMITTYIF